MIFNKLEAWVTSANGQDKLTEYLRRRTENNTVEYDCLLSRAFKKLLTIHRCWVPSNEGSKFGIKFKHADPAPKRCRFGLTVTTYFDGDKVLAQFALPSQVNERIHYFDAKYTEKAKQCFQFGKL